MRDHLGNPMFSGDPAYAPGVLLLEDCEGTFTWTVSGTGGDDVHAFATAAAFHGTYGMQLKTRTTGAALGDNLYVRKYIGFPESGLLVLRARVAFVDATKFAGLEVGVSLSDGATAYEGYIKVAPQTPAVSYLNSAAGWTAIAALAKKPYGAAFTVLEVIFDLRTMKYLEVVWNGIRATDVNAAMLTGAAETQRGVLLSIMIETDGAAAAELYIDHVYAGEFLDV